MGWQDNTRLSKYTPEKVLYMDEDMARMVCMVEAGKTKNPYLSVVGEPGRWGIQDTRDRTMLYVDGEYR